MKDGKIALKDSYLKVDLRMANDTVLWSRPGAASHGPR